MTTKKKSVVKKVPAKKTPASKTKPSAKKPVAKRPAPKAKKAASKNISGQHLEDALTKQALKFVDEAALLLRSGIKTSQKNTSKARETAHKKAHLLLGKATRHLDDALKSSSSFLRQAINKL